MPQKTLASIKYTVGIVGGLITIFVFLQPYFNLVAKADQHEAEIKLIKQKQETDHDLLIQISRDIQYVKEFLAEKRNNK